MIKNPKKYIYCEKYTIKNWFYGKIIKNVIIQISMRQSNISAQKEGPFDAL